MAMACVRSIDFGFFSRSVLDSFHSSFFALPRNSLKSKFQNNKHSKILRHLLHSRHSSILEIASPNVSLCVCELRESNEEKKAVGLMLGSPIFDFWIIALPFYLVFIHATPRSIDHKKCNTYFKSYKYRWKYIVLFTKAHFHFPILVVVFFSLSFFSFCCRCWHCHRCRHRRRFQFNGTYYWLEFRLTANRARRRNQVSTCDGRLHYLDAITIHTEVNNTDNTMHTVKTKQNIYVYMKQKEKNRTKKKENMCACV